ncbi:MAG: transglutaminase domain-containing protein [Ignavibacteriaceae bacterium]
MYSIYLTAQSSFGLSGYWGSAPKQVTILNNLENNISNYSYIKDWGISITYGGEFSNSAAYNLYSLSLLKTIGNNAFAAQYTPGYQKEFIFNTSTSILFDTTKNQSLNASFTYKELFGFGYSYKFNKNISAGFSLKFFNQEFNREILNSVFKIDTVYLERINDNKKANSWTGDIGLSYFMNDKLSFSLSSINLLSSGDISSPEFEKYKFKFDKKALLGFSYSPVSDFDFNLLYETTNSFQVSSVLEKLFSGNFNIGLTVFHDKYQSPFIAGILPSVSYFNKLFGVTLSGVKYFSDRNTIGSFSDFERNGIHNIINNQYSFDKATLTISLMLNTKPEREIEFLGVNEVQNIYPTLYENYLNKPFAIGKIVNITNKFITVKPACRIEGINTEKIQSPLVKVGPKDTADIPFYALIPDNYTNNKTTISYADFFVTTVNENPDEHIQKPTLVNSINSWDGKVINLKYFINKELNYSMTYAKDVLAKYKKELDTMSYRLSNFYKAKMIFNECIKKIVYSSDPKASADYVQFPQETMELKGGDCDDLSVLYSSLLESIGIQTALVDYKPGSGIGHVNVMVNTELSPQQASLITKNDNKYLIRKNRKGVDQVWIVVETTSLSDFNSAWDIGMGKFNKDALNNLGLAKGKVEIVDMN